MGPAGRAWSSAVAIWANGRCEAMALAPGVPDLEAQEKRDRVPSGVYQRLAYAGRLRVAEGLRVQPPSQLWEMVLEEWGWPALVLCDRFRLSDLQDTGAGPLEPRVTRWSEAAEDIRALRKMALDGPLAPERDSRGLLTVSLSQAHVQNDTSGNFRLVKNGTNNTSRDDVAAALLLAAGAFQRYPPPPEETEPRRPVVVG